MGQFRSFDNLVHAFMCGASFCREADHGDCRVESGDIFCCLCRGDRDLCELLCGGIRNNRAVGEDEHLVFSEGAGLGEKHDEGSAHYGDAWFCLEHLEGCTKHVGCGAECSGNHGVTVAALDHKATEIQRIKHRLAGFLDGHAFFLAQFLKQDCVWLCE